ncbi:MAG: hypothetical protein KDJ98_14745 [Rhodobacteraceae bacterium]|nr:hypothetical protein [Paracoccaceae bacterium]
MTPTVDHVPTIADPETTSFEDEVPAEATAVAGSLFWAFALLALLVLPLATRTGRRALGWVQEPWSWPFFALTVSLIAGSLFVWHFRQLLKDGALASAFRIAFAGMDRAIFYATGFLIFLGGVAYLGFSLASLIFLQALFFACGLRGGKWPWIALGVGLAIVLAFRIGLGIWFPLAPVMSLLPDWIGSRFGAWL